MSLIVITNEQLDGIRGVIDHEALPEFAVRGWIEVGPAVSVQDARTLDEAAADQDAPDVVEAPTPAPKPAKRPARKKTTTSTPPAVEATTTPDPADDVADNPKE